MDPSQRIQLEVTYEAIENGKRPRITYVFSTPFDTNYLATL